MHKLISLVFSALFFSSIVFGQQTDAALRSVIEKDRSSRDATGKLMTLPVADHIYRGDVYMANRAFREAREHFQKIMEVYPSDAGMSKALFGIGRSFMWEREYNKAIPFLDRVSREYPLTKDGREGLNFKGACNVRISKHAEAAKIYEQYTIMYPAGERIDGAFLNTIDALRESGQYEQANAWVAKARSRFPGKPTEVNALHARLRMEVYRGLWSYAETTANDILSIDKFSGTITGPDEVKYLKAFVMEKAGKNKESMAIYTSILGKANSYYSVLAEEKLAGIKGSVKATAQALPKDYPVMFRIEILQYSKKHKIDPRFVLAIMKQESSFRTDVKSPSAARGLLQLVMDTALKYSKKAGFTSLQPDDLYNPRINIAIGCEYIADLKTEFGGLYEAIAASYNGGEDNARRWLNRSKPKDAAIFTSEVGFPETKNYVFKVMTNFRIYRELYDENLARR